MAKKQVHLVGQVEGMKPRVKAAVTNSYKQLQRPALFQGQTKVYTPTRADDAAEQLPPETTKVQLRVRDVLAEIIKSESELLDKVFQQDQGNTLAKADIVVNGVVLKKDVPITFLMYLRKRLEEMRTAYSAIPTPDPAISWVYDPNLGLLRSESEVITSRTTKQPFKFEKAAATERFPAQVEILYRDEKVGEWKRREFSGAERADIKEALVKNISLLLDATQQAIESANISVNASDDTIADTLFKFIMEPVIRTYAA